MKRALISILLITTAHAQVPQVRDGMANVPGAQIHYRETGGTGQAVIFLHSATGHSQVWERQIPAITSAGYRFIAYDRRGWGSSIIKENNAATGADDLLSLLENLKIDRAHLVATAAGGFVAVDFALSFPQRVRSLVIANSIGGVQDEDYLELGRKLRPSPQFDAMPPEFRELGPSFRASDPAGTARWVQFEKTSRPEGPRAPAQGMRNRVTFSLLETLSVPTLFITGGADLYMPPPLLRRFSDRVKNSETFVIPEAGHSAYWEQPEVFNRAVVAFLTKH